MSDKELIANVANCAMWIFILCATLGSVILLANYAAERAMPELKPLTLCIDAEKMVRPDWQGCAGWPDKIKQEAGE